MLNKQRAIKIAKRIANKLMEIKEVKAVGIYGSYAKGYADRFTDDIDLVAFCEKIPDKKERERKMKEINAKKIRDADSIDPILFENVEATIFYKTIEEAKRWIDSFKKWEGLENEIAVFIENMKPIADPKHIIKKLKKSASYTDEMRKKVFEQRFFVVVRTKPLLENSLKRNNTIFINSRLNDSFRAYCNLLYALNRIYFSDVKWIKNDLEKFRLKPKRCFEKLEEFNMLGCRNHEVKRRLEILKSLAEDTATVAKNAGMNVSKSLKELEKW